MYAFDVNTLGLQRTGRHLPDRDTVAEIHAPAGEAIDAMTAAQLATADALAALKSAQRGGDDYRDAATADVAAAVAGKPVKALAKVINSEPERYAHALALVTSEGARIDALRQRHSDVLSALAETAQAEAAALVEELRTLARTAWEQRSRAAGIAAYEGLEVVLERLRVLQAVAGWASGREAMYDSSRAPVAALTPAERGCLIAAGAHHRGLSDLALWEGDAAAPDDYASPFGREFDTGDRGAPTSALKARR